MWPLFTLCAFVAVSGYYLMTYEVRQISTPARVSSQHALAVNLSVYRDLVTSYVRSQPAPVPADTVVHDGLLSYPSWYTRHAAWRNRVVDGSQLVVYGEVPYAADVAEELSSLAQGSILAGRALPATSGTNLTLHSSQHGDTGIVLPNVVPVGSVAWIATLK